MKNLLVLCLISFFINSFGQTTTWTWAKSPSIEKFLGTKIGSDALNNSYLYGYYSNTLSIGSTTFIQPNNINYGGYFLKLDPNGNVLSAVNFTNGNIAIVDGATDSQGNSYVIGFTPTYGIIGTYSLGAQYNKSQFFLMKIGPNGNLIWFQSPEKGSGAVSKIFLHGNNLYWGGTFAGTLAISSSTVFPNYSSLYSEDYFVAKYDTSGNFQWLRSGGGEGYDGDSYIVVDSSGDLYLSAFSSSTLITVGSNTFVGTNNSPAMCFFLAKYDSNGNLYWGKTFAPAGNAKLKALASTNNGCIMAGNFVNSFAVGSTTMTSQNTIGFVAKLDSNGNQVWTDEIGSGTYSSVDDISIDAFGNTYALGTFSGTSASIQNITLVNDSNQKSIFLGIFSGNGQIQTVDKIGSNYEETADDLCLDNFGNVAIVGHFKGPYTVIGTQTLVNNNYNSANPKSTTFIARTSGPLVGIEDIDIEKELMIYPNPANDKVTISNSDNFDRYELYDLAGRKVVGGVIDFESINIEMIPNGFYLLKIFDSQNSISTKLIIQR